MEGRAVVNLPDRFFKQFDATGSLTIGDMRGDECLMTTAGDAVCDVSDVHLPVIHSHPPWAPFERVYMGWVHARA